MISTRYIVNKSLHVAPVDNDTVAVVSSKNKFVVKGSGMAIAIGRVLDCFVSAAHIDEVHTSLSGIYGSSSLNKLFSFLIDKGVLVKEQDADFLINKDKSFPEKTFSYVIGSKTLQEVVEAMAPIHIGIISTAQLAHRLTHELASSQLVNNIHLAATDREAGEDLDYNSEDVRVIIYPTDPSLTYLHSIADASDLLVIASNYHDHYLFSKINEICHKKGKKWLRVVAEGVNAEIGPLFIPGETCCYSCLLTRRRNNLIADEYVFESLYSSERLHNEVKVHPTTFSTLYPLGAMVVGITCAEVMKHLTGGECILVNQVLAISATDYQAQSSYIHKNYQCPVCIKKGE